MSRPNIRTALIAMFSVMGLIFVVFSAFAISRMAVINQSTADIADNWMPSLEYAKAADNAFTDLRLGWRSHVVASSKRRMMDAEADITAAKARLTTALVDYDKIYTFPIELEITGKIRTGLAEYDRLADQQFRWKRADPRRWKRRLPCRL